VHHLKVIEVVKVDKEPLILDQKDLWVQLIQVHKDLVVQRDQQVMMGQRDLKVIKVVLVPKDIKV
jgi:hypothetical protein